MESLFQYVAPPSMCGYLPEQEWSLEYNYVNQLTPAEYLLHLLDNWRRFGNMLFRPVCASCHACRSLRVPVARFRPDRSQKRCRKTNEGVLERRIGEPTVNRAKLALYDRYHAFQADHKGWPGHAPRDTASYADSFVHHPFPVEEWCYYLEGRLIGVGYVDVLPGNKSEIRNPKSSPLRGKSEIQNPKSEGNAKTEEEKRKNKEKAEEAEHAGQPASDFENSDLDFPSGFGFRISDLKEEGGLSAIYFFYDPRHRERALGTWNVLSLIEEAARRQLPYVYLGYYVEGCGSMSYKTRFVPNQLRGEDGVWRDFRV